MTSIPAGSSGSAGIDLRQEDWCGLASSSDGQGGAEVRVFSTDEKIVAWLAQVARHAFIDYVRKQNRQQSNHSLSSPCLISKPGQPARRALMQCSTGIEPLDAEEWALVESAISGQNHGELAPKAANCKAVESKLARIRPNFRKFIVNETKI